MIPNQNYYQQNGVYNPYQLNPYAYMNNPADIDISWAQGEAGAKSFPVQAGHKKLIMDSESEKFFIKEVDSNGIPLPLRVFQYTEITPQQPVATQPMDQSNFATKEEVGELKDLILDIKNNLNNRNNRRDNKTNNG